MKNKLTSLIRYALVAGILLALIIPTQLHVLAAANLTITPITWNIMGLDSNNVNVGPNHFPVGVRVCNTGDAAATNVASTFVWDTADLYINLRTGTLTSFTGTNAVASLAPNTCTDFYDEVAITRNASAYNHIRRYHITATADGLATVSTAIPREIFVEHLVSQNRNTVSDVQLDGVSIPSGGTMTLMVGQSYTIKLVGSTATQGYEQIESFINFPNTVFQVQFVITTYSAATSPIFTRNTRKGPEIRKTSTKPRTYAALSFLDVAGDSASSHSQVEYKGEYASLQGLRQVSTVGASSSSSTSPC